jgi:hypothetical protein
MENIGRQVHRNPVPPTELFDPHDASLALYRGLSEIHGEMDRIAD